MPKTVYLAIRACVLLIMFAGFVAFVTLGNAAPVPPDCDGTKIGSPPGGLCGTATPCPTINNQAACLTEPETLCVARFPLYPQCSSGGTKSQKCVNRTDIVCTWTYVCDWVTTEDGVSYCDCGTTPYLESGEFVYSLQPAGYLVSCVDKS